MTETSRRLLGSSARRSYDPDVDLDWDAPLVEGAYCIPPHRVSLYGTALWDRLDESQRATLSKHEAASMASVGVWFEIILMRLLGRHLAKMDPTSPRMQYGLVEIADECRHSIMFGKAIERLRVRPYGPQRLPRLLGEVMVQTARGPSMWAGFLLAEEILDRMQREAMADERVQPLVRMVNRIHVLEEARHVRYAREELLASAAGCSKIAMAYHQGATAHAALVISRNLIHPDVYAAVGLDPASTRRIALGNPHYQATLAWSAERVVEFFRQAGLIGRVGRHYWQRSYLMGS
jgi:P-aminobenzoate N-oxygenase AurF